MELDAFIRGLGRRLPHPFENLVVVARVASTNALARRIVAECQEESCRLLPSAILALEQSAGRGRHGNTWASPAGRGVYATVILPLPEMAVAPTLPLLVGVGLCRGLNRHLDGAACRLKWPNDLLVDRRKIGGVLIETVTTPQRDPVALIGFGVNHGQGAGELPTPNATSLRLAAGQPPDLATLAADLLDALREELAHLGDAAYAVESYQALSLHRPGETLRCRLADGVVEGRFLGFDHQGLLLLESDGEKRRLAAGEVETP